MLCFDIRIGGGKAPLKLKMLVIYRPGNNTPRRPNTPRQLQIGVDDYKCKWQLYGSRRTQELLTISKGCQKPGGI